MRIDAIQEAAPARPALREYTEDLRIRVGLHVLRLRLKRGWTQRELADRVSTDQGRIAHIEAGDANLTVRGLGRLADALGVDAPELLRPRLAAPPLRRRRARDLMLEFTWEAEKARSNVALHGITFEEAITLFGDPLSATILDPDHSFGEERYLTMGLSDRDRLVVVWYAEQDDVIRIIGARLVTRKERRDYEEEE